MKAFHLLAAVPTALLSVGAAEPVPVKSEAANCAALLSAPASNALVPGLKVVAANWHPVGLIIDLGRGEKSPPLAAHCEVQGALQDRVGEGGQRYAIRFKMRLPEAWNNRFFFQGGGGSNGVIGNATGPTGAGNAQALTLGYAVISQDSGHDNALNTDPARSGQLVFGFDPVARRNYGHASLKLTNDAAHAVIRRFYNRDARYSYFYGCSKGGQEGMAFAQKYPKSFDGIVAAAPGFSLPKAALAEVWDVQSFATLAGPGATVAALAKTFSSADFQIVRDAILKTCDKDDGAEDGMLSAVGKCTTARMTPALQARQCSGDKTADCLSTGQITALIRVIDGPRDAAGKSLYAPFAWDPSIGLDGWSSWKIGLQSGLPALNVILGGGSLASVFTTPPTPLSISPETVLAWQLAFDVNKDGGKIFARSAPGVPSAWEDISARSSNLSAFRARGGKLIVPHGVADPVFSINDTLAWRDEVNAQSSGQADSFVRVFPVPGMNHCGGGNATDRFDAFTALVNWVEKRRAPQSIPATAGPASAWPGRERPLCPYPQYAQPVSGTDRFECRK
jgi:hypothetical protein